MLGRGREIRAITLELAGVKSDDSVLDVGCGPGRLDVAAKAIVGRTGKVFGIDPSPEMIRLARRNAERAGADIDFRVGIAEELPYDNESFDVVMSSLVLHHIAEEGRQGALDEMFRVLKAGGRMLSLEFEPPERGLAVAVVRHVTGGRMSSIDLGRYLTMMERAGFHDASSGKTRFGILVYVEGIKLEAA
jgi:demethylmenaquinone methyltransferase/2-methoxy-6-polyprenyl-1,4-benzoquinol methylase/phosphoethanolamine N-methyltransferase